MNKILLIFLAVFIAAGVLAQVPERMSYQAVVRNGKNALIANRQIGLRISILQGTVTGPEVYREIFSPNPVTNANGLFTAEIGSGTPTLGTFSSINWANGPYFIQSEIDTTGGTNYVITGTTRLLSVPYALHAKTAETLSGTITETDPAFTAWDKDYNDIINKPDLNNYVTKDMLNQDSTNIDYNFDIVDYNDIINKPDLSNYATIDMINQNPASLDYNNLLNKPDLSNFATTDMLNQNPTSLNYNDLINKPDLSNYATIDMLNQNPASLDYNNLLNKPDLSNYATIDMINQNPASTDYNDLLNKPDLSIYATKNMANQNITNLADPVNAQDAATKAYVDALLKKIEELINENQLTEGFFDTRDANYYKTVKIGSQVWMAENLKYLPAITGPDFWSETEPYYYVNGYDGTNVNEAKATVNYNTYGVLYNWSAAFNGAPDNLNPSGVQGVCPDGWHLPGYTEWEQLIDYLGGEEIAGGKLKETGTIHWESPNTGATNESGFTALPGGMFWKWDDFYFLENGFNGSWWSASWDNKTIGYYIFTLYYNNLSSFAEWWDAIWQPKACGFSVRCVKD